MRTTRSVIVGGVVGMAILAFLGLFGLLGVATWMLGAIGVACICSVFAIIETLLAPGEWRRTGLGTPYRAINPPPPQTVVAAIITAAGLIIYFAYLMLR